MAVKGTRKQPTKKPLSKQPPKAPDGEKYLYGFTQGGEKKHDGITNDPTRREKEHQQRWKGGKLEVKQGPMPEDKARAKEAKLPKAITPKPGPKPKPKPKPRKR
ncbi:MAG: hypothetical protein HYR64_07750 [Fimbriimonas ginsengisoli]|uniref:Uncharacterized protein n=1 Tax=Fimbriimonas ginsengisoli TaxID=1005039 RepID=A0A931LT51_FIMGI|nr:hypothetical protein [Fimbriimonas ginsengisoli]